MFLVKVFQTLFSCSWSGLLIHCKSEAIQELLVFDNNISLYFDGDVL